MFGLLFLKRLLDSFWKTEWQSVCSQFHLKPQQREEGINTWWFDICHTLWGTETHDHFQSTTKPVQHDRHSWTKEKGAVTKYSYQKKKK